MADSTVTLPDDSANTGKKLDESAIVVGGVTVLRQRVNLADSRMAGNLAGVTVEGALMVVAQQNDEILVQLKRIAMLLQIVADEEISADEVS